MINIHLQLSVAHCVDTVFVFASLGSHHDIICDVMGNKIIKATSRKPKINLLLFAVVPLDGSPPVESGACMEADRTGCF